MAHAQADGSHLPRPSSRRGKPLRPQVVLAELQQLSGPHAVRDRSTCSAHTRGRPCRPSQFPSVKLAIHGVGDVCREGWALAHSFNRCLAYNSSPSNAATPSLSLPAGAPLDTEKCGTALSGS